MKKFFFVLSRLWRFHNLYFLKPNDAINDTLTASLLYKFNWSGKILELGSGDGVFSYVMHGGYFPLWFDRYLITDLHKNDIYDLHKKGILKTSVILEKPAIYLAVDAKLSHVKKIQEIGFVKTAVVSAYENLPIASNSVEKIFYYTPHGLKDHDAAISEAHRVLVFNGEMLILLFNKNINSSFLFYRLSKVTRGKLRSFFLGLDAGRHDEITRLSKSANEWKLFFSCHGFSIEEEYMGLSEFAWKIYDTQTRPILKILISTFNIFPTPLRMIFKFIWMAVCYPYLIIFYFLFSNQYLVIDKKNCYVAYRLRKIN